MRYHNLFENSSEFLFTLDLKGNFTDVNKAAEVLTGYTKPELLKMNFKDYTPRKDHKKLFKNFFHIYKTGTPLHDYPIEAVMKDKSVKHFETTFSLMRKGGEIIGYQGTSKDITERKRAEESLRLALENTETILEEIPVGVVIISKDRKIKRINYTALKMSGEENADNILGKDCGEYLCPAQQTECPILDKMQQVDKSERIFRRKDGKEIPIIKSVTEINLDGEDILLETFIDITERKQAESQRKATLKALWESEEKLKTILKSTDDVIFQISPTGFIKYVSPSVESWGYKSEDLIGKHLKKTTPLSEVPKALKIMKSIMSGEVIDLLEMNQIDVNGNIIPVEIRITPVRKEGKIIAMQGVMRDITERKKAEEEIKENEDRYRQIYQFSPDSVIIHDMDMNILDVNNKAVEELGYSKKELLKKTIYELHPETEQKHSAQVLDVMKKKDMLNVETKFVRKDGSVFLAEATPCKYKLGSKTIIHVVIRDITERKQAEDKIRVERDKLQLLMDGLSQTKIGVDV
ncbi:MAG: PAS domain S-box protein, partial [Candidatus Tenebribacter mawsonii]|nr:PAS domain S-box protein [Candidatus Tenebribacter mawsonii]